MSNFVPLQNKQQAGKVPIKVLVVDDSSLVRTLIVSMLDDVADIIVVGQATNGLEAVRMALRLKPDVVTMDIRMPQMDGLEATRRIMSLQPTPIVVLSSSVYASDYGVAFNAIEAGALTVIEKPKGLGTQDYDLVRAQLITSIRTMAGVAVVGRPTGSLRRDGVGLRTAMLHEIFSRSVGLIGIASSTGGPPVLMQLFSSLPKDFSIPIIVVQHILAPFAPAMVEWLNTRSALPVVLASDGIRYSPGKILICPGDRHLTVSAGGIVRVDDGEPVQGQRPSANRMFESMSRMAGASSVGIILTGMGDDGVDGLSSLSKAGGHVIAQDEGSCVIFGMPKMAIQRGVVDEVLSPEGIIQRLTKLHHHSLNVSGTTNLFH